MQRQTERYEDAARLFIESGLWKDAAAIYLEQKEYRRAAQVFLQGNLFREAAEALEAGGDHSAARRIHAKLALEKGDYEAAAEAFDDAGEFVLAAKVQLRLGRFDAAGASFQRAGEHALAARAYLKSGDLLAAARALEDSGELLEAARCYEKAGATDRALDLLESSGEILEAARIAIALGQHDRATGRLAAVAPGTRDYKTSRLLLARCAVDRADHATALEQFEEALGSETVRDDNIDDFYRLGVLQEEIGNKSRAHAIYRAITAHAPDFRDVRARLDAPTAPRTDAGTPPGASTDANGQTYLQNRYRVVEELGRGGMGIVYKAQDSYLDRMVAYKVLTDELKADPDAWQELLKEAKATASLNHPNIVGIHDVGNAAGTCFIIMEYVEGTTLKQLVEKMGPLPYAEAYTIIEQCCDAMAYAHSKRLVHRDIKPGNIMLSTEDTVKILDFGLARIAAANEASLMASRVIGTPYFISPEQILGERFDHRADIYSLGVTFYNLLTGAYPFTGRDISYHHLHTEPPDPRTVNPDIPEPVARAILRCLAKKREDRYQSASEIIEALNV